MVVSQTGLFPGHYTPDEDVISVWSRVSDAVASKYSHVMFDAEREPEDNTPPAQLSSTELVTSMMTDEYNLLDAVELGIDVPVLTANIPFQIVERAEVVEKLDAFHVARDTAPVIDLSTQPNFELLRLAKEAEVRGLHPDLVRTANQDRSEEDDDDTKLRSGIRPRHRSDAVGSTTGPLDDVATAKQTLMRHSYENYFSYVRLETEALELDMRQIVTILSCGRIPASVPGIAQSRLAGLCTLNRTPNGQYRGKTICDNAIAVYDPDAETSCLNVNTGTVANVKGKIVEVAKVTCVDGNDVTVEVASTSAVLYLNNDLADFLTIRLLRTLQLTKTVSFNPVRRFINRAGVAACGKTYGIATSLKAGDVALSSTRSSRDELLKTMKRLHDDPQTRDLVVNVDSVCIATVGSYIFKPENKRHRSGVLHLDEAIMMHPGEVYLVAELCGAHTVYCHADPLQLKFIPRVDEFDMQSSAIVWDERTVNLTTRLTPADCVVLNRNPKYGGYGSEYTTMSKVDRSFSVVRLASAQALKTLPLTSSISDEPILFMTWTRDDMRIMRSYGFKDCITVGMSQGGRADHVVLVRIAKFLPASLGENGPQKLVATTRHRRRMEYVVVGQPGKSDWVLDAWNELSGVRDFRRELDHPTMKFETVPEYHAIIGGARIFGGMTIEAMKTAVVDKIVRLAGNSPRDDIVERTGGDVKGEFPVSRNPLQSTRLGVCAHVIQEAYDDALPGVSDERREFDNDVREYSPINFSMHGYFRNNFSVLPKTKQTKTFKPYVMTDAEPPRAVTHRSLLMALNKRNMAAFITRGYESPGIVEKVMRHCLQTYWNGNVDTWLEYFQSHPITVNPKNVKDFISAQTEPTVKAIMQHDLDMAEFEMNKYAMILKSICKAASTVEAAGTWGQPQVIVFMSKAYNAIFGPMMREAFERLLLPCKNNVLVNKGKTVNDLQKHALDFTDGMGATVPTYIENDFSKYDKTQEQTVFKMEMWFYRNIGFDKEFCKMWSDGHEVSSAKSFETGLTMWTMFQRKSGDVTTSLGNTLVNMATVAYAYFDRPEYFQNVKFAWFLGDDSLIATDAITADKIYKRGSSKMASIFNLQAKLIVTKHAYFCGNFIIPTIDGPRLFCDPLRRIAKLGRWDVRFESNFEEHLTALRDQLVGYDDAGLCDVAADVISARLQGVQNETGIRLAIAALSDLQKNPVAFRKLWAVGADVRV